MFIIFCKFDLLFDPYGRHSIKLLLPKGPMSFQPFYLTPFVYIFISDIYVSLWGL